MKIGEKKIKYTLICGFVGSVSAEIWRRKLSSCGCCKALSVDTKPDQMCFVNVTCNAIHQLYKFNLYKPNNRAKHPLLRLNGTRVRSRTAL